MNITVIGHAGLLIETNGKKIVCDPWFSETGAFLCSWHQWPRNDRLDAGLMEKIMTADYLYVSHLHRDHFDEEFLRDYFVKNPEVQILVPKFHEPNILSRELGKLGGNNQISMEDRVSQEFDGFQMEIMIDWAGTYANKGDSGLLVTDQDGRVLNQNDSKHTEYPENIDVHFTQFSGAIWYPMAYRKSMKDDNEYLSIVASEIERREVAFVTTVHNSKAAHVFPHAGPPVFLRDNQRWLNDTGESIFYDQPELLSYLEEHGIDNAHPVYPEMVVSIEKGEVSYNYPGGMTEQDVLAYYQPDNKASEIAKYAEDRRAVIEAFDNSLPMPTEDLGANMIEWLTPVLQAKAELADKIGGNIAVLSDDGEVKVLLDCTAHEARPLYESDNFDHSFTIPRRIMEKMYQDKQRVWTSEVFLGAVHESWRKGAYNRYVYDLLAQMAVPPIPKPTA